MARDSKSAEKKPDLKYQQVRVDALDKGRCGKHYDLVLGILRQLKTVPPGSAIEIPLDGVGGIGLVKPSLRCSSLFDLARA
jgi:hypothetical protein